MAKKRSALGLPADDYTAICNEKSTYLDDPINCKVLSFNKATNILVFEFNGMAIQTNEAKYDGNQGEIWVRHRGNRFEF